MKATGTFTGIVLLLLFIFTPVLMFGQETTLMIRVKSKDAKFIGSSIGGAKVIVREEATGTILAEGVTRGSTGDTQKIMNESRTRNMVLSDEDTAGFLASLDIAEPVFVTVEVFAPINKRQAKVTSSTQLWVIPGKNIGGDGLVVEVPGFVVDVLSPQTHERIEAAKEITIVANVVLMCGCPVTKEGMWDANQYEVKALIEKEGEQQESVLLQAGDKPSTFEGKIQLPPGNYGITVYAFDPVAGNTGVDKTNIIVQ